MSLQTVRLALFDFDDTIARGDSVVPYLLYAIRCRKAPLRQLPIAVGAFIRQHFHPELVSYAKSRALSFIKGVPQAAMDDFARDFFRHVQSKRFFRDAVAELTRLHNEGYHIVIASASAEAYMRVLPEFLPVDAVISTRCMTDDDGCYTGDVGENCRGMSKALRVAEYLAAHHLTAEPGTGRAYGDSASDEPLLRMVAQQYLVNPAEKLKAALPDATILRWK